MEFPFGHQQHRHHRGEEEREEQPYPPPGQRPDPYGRQEEYRRPPPYGRQEEGYYGGEENTYPRPPPPSGLGYGPGSDYPPVQHVAHETNQGPYPSPGGYGYGREEKGGRYGGSEGGQSQHSSFTSVIHRHHTHEGSGVIPSSGGRTVRVFTKAEGNYSLTIRDGKVVLARSNPNDEYQHWIKDEKYSTKVKDKEGHPSFALVNKVTGEAIKHSIGEQHPVRLIPYNPEYLDESILWTESKDLGDGFRCIRMVNNILLNFDAFNGDANHGGVRDGTTIVLWEWLTGENQRWRIVPYCKFFPLN